MGISIWMLMLVVLPLAVLPSIIALLRNHPYKLPIILINILGGLLFGVGWVVALVWCFIVPDQVKTGISQAEALEKLHQLKEKGVLSEAEFDAQKSQLLNG